MRNVDIGQALAWLVVFLTAWGAASYTLHTLIEKIGVKNFLKQLETRFNLPAEVRQFLLPVAAFGVALYAIWTGEINLFVILPIPIFDNVPEWMLWFINALFVAGGAFIEHAWFERMIEAAKKAKEIWDLFFIPIGNGQNVEVKIPRNGTQMEQYAKLLQAAAENHPELKAHKESFTHAA